MISEVRRRDYLQAMQVDTWLPRVALPFAAPSRPECLKPPLPMAAPGEPAPAEIEPTPVSAPSPAPERPAVARETLRSRLIAPEPRRETIVEAAPEAETDATPALASEAVPPPRFTLQLLRAGACLVLVELPTGEPFASRDPAYLLLKDMLRAAGLPDSPQQVGDGEPIRWPLVAGRRFGQGAPLDQGPQAALDYVQGVIAVELEQQPSACLWLIGEPAIRFAGEADAEACNRELNIEGLGVALAMPGLEALMEEPARKAPLWRAMQRSMGRWKTV